MNWKLHLLLANTFMIWANVTDMVGVAAFLALCAAGAGIMALVHYLAELRK